MFNFLHKDGETIEDAQKEMLEVIEDAGKNVPREQEAAVSVIAGALGLVWFELRITNTILSDIKEHLARPVGD